jgi:hypothetical protein
MMVPRRGGWLLHLAGKGCCGTRFGSGEAALRTTAPLWRKSAGAAGGTEPRHASSPL